MKPGSSTFFADYAYSRLAELFKLSERHIQKLNGQSARKQKCKRGWWC